MAAQAEDVSTDWAKKTKDDSCAAEAPFPYFFSAWVNLPKGRGKVLCLPHKDWKNTAAFWCAIFCYGKQQQPFTTSKPAPLPCCLQEFFPEMIVFTWSFGNLGLYWSSCQALGSSFLLPY